MTNLQVSAITTGIVCILANFLWQATHDRKWTKAAERSWFQVAAIGVFLMLSIGRP